MTEFRNGTRVRAVVEGTVENGTRRDDKVSVVRDDGHHHYFKPEHLTVIEPEYETGKYYMDDMGRVYRRNRGDWFSTQEHGHYCGDNVPVRPLRKLVPENG